MSKYAATIVLVLIILNGCFGIFIAIYPRLRHPTDAKRERYPLRGMLTIFVGSISLFLLRLDAINVWAALLPVSFLLMLGEYLLAGREKRQLIRKGLYEPAELENRERQQWERVRAKGQWRYVGEQVMIYGAGGFLLIAALHISMSESLPFYLWIAGALFAAFCGGVAALEKWKRQRP